MTDQEVENCYRSNPDGAGMAWAENDRVSVRKGFMTLDAFNLAYADFQLSHPEFIPHVVHFRVATSGGSSPEMTHPYKMTPDSELLVSEDTDASVLFHNGVIPDWKTSLINMVTSKQIPKMPKGSMNDTRMAAIMASVPTIGDEILEVLSGKFVKVQPDGTIIRWGKFEFENGVYFSNTSYKWKVYRFKNECIGNKNINSCYRQNGCYEYFQDDVPEVTGYSDKDNQALLKADTSDIDFKILELICHDICNGLFKISFSDNVKVDGIRTTQVENVITIEICEKTYPREDLVISAIARELVHVMNGSIEEDYISFTNDLVEMEGWLLYDYYNKKK